MAARKPNCDRLYEVASAQAGYFTTRQAHEAGYSWPLLYKHLRRRRITRSRRGVYRLVHFPPADHEELAVIWLWSEQAGVFSHETALALHGLSDVLPTRVHLTVPAPWRRRRLRVPTHVVLHFAGVPKRERRWFGPVPAEAPARALNGCAREGLSPELLRQASAQAIARGLVTKRELGDVAEALEPFGGLAT